MQQMSTPSPLNALRGVDFIDENIGWAVGEVGMNAGCFLNTSNGGKTWTVAPMGAGGVLYDVDFIDKDTGWAVGGSSMPTGCIYNTSNGGKTWTQYTSAILLPKFYGVAFKTNTDGWAVGAGGAIFSTADGGKLWTAETSGTIKDLHDVDFIRGAAKTPIGWAVGNGGVICHTPAPITTEFMPVVITFFAGIAMIVGFVRLKKR
jgi:photosystem II stability/assembly factor-like uncharacterized protein